MTVPYDQESALKLLAKGKEEGFDWLYSHYAKRVAQVSYRVLRSQEQAEDVMQEIFIKLWQERERFVKADDFEAFLFTCVRNKTLDYLKEQTKEDVARIKAAALRKLDENSIDDFIRDQELTELVSKVVNELPEQRKRVFTMVTDEGMNRNDVAAQLNIDHRTVDNHIYNARVFIWKRIQHLVAIAVPFLLSTLHFG